MPFDAGAEDELMPPKTALSRPPNLLVVDLGCCDGPASSGTSGAALECCGRRGGNECSKLAAGDWLLIEDDDIVSASMPVRTPYNMTQ